MGAITLGTGVGLDADVGDDPLKDLCVVSLLALRFVLLVTAENRRQAATDALGGDKIDAVVAAVLDEFGEAQIDGKDEAVAGWRIRRLIPLAWERAGAEWERSGSV